MDDDLEELLSVEVTPRLLQAYRCVARFSGRRMPPWHGHLARVKFHGLEARATRLPENLAAHSVSKFVDIGFNL